MILGSLWNSTHPPPREQFATANESDANLVKRLVTKSGIRIHIVDTPGRESISLATPRSNNLLLSEKVTETSRPIIAMHTEGDIHLRAEGRIHEHAALQSHHIDGKIMHGATISFADSLGQTDSYEDTAVQLGLTDGSTYDGPIASGQSFNAIPPGQNQVQAPNFYPPRYAPRAKPVGQ